MSNVPGEGLFCTGCGAFCEYHVVLSNEKGIQCKDGGWGVAIASHTRAHGSTGYIVKGTDIV
jgi:hypothetical protein